MNEKVERLVDLVVAQEVEVDAAEMILRVRKAALFSAVGVAGGIRLLRAVRGPR